MQKISKSNTGMHQVMKANYDKQKPYVKQTKNQGKQINKLLAQLIKSSNCDSGNEEKNMDHTQFKNGIK